MGLSYPAYLDRMGIYSKDNADFGAALDAGIQEVHSSGQLAEILTANGLAASGADVGEPHLVK